MKNRAMHHVSGCLLLVSLGFAATASCSDGNAPDELTCPGADAVLCTASAETVTAVRAAVHDIDLRITGGLADETVRSALSADAPDLSQALADGRVSDARDLISRMQRAVDEAQARAAHPGDAPDLTAAELSLRAADTLVQ